MRQELIAGIIFCILGCILSVKPHVVWEAAEKWKFKAVSEDVGPSELYTTAMWILGGAFIGLGILLAAGYVR